MRVRIKVLLFILLLAGAPLLYAQEFNCKVFVDASTIQASGNQSYLDKSFITGMQRSFTQFVTDRTWTNVKMDVKERITLNIQITITEVPDIGRFKATTLVQALRPVYGTGYESLLFSFIDKEFEFEYNIGQGLEYNENVYTANIVSLLAFYAYTVLGFDFDSFSNLGGSPYHEKALNILNAAQQSGRPGWSAFGGGSNTRYHLNENLLNQQFVPFREAVYTYHRLGMDRLADEPVEARKSVAESIEKLKKVHDIRPGSLLMRSYLNAKSEEISKVMKDALPQEKNAAYETLKRIDPTNTQTYDKIMK